MLKIRKIEILQDSGWALEEQCPDVTVELQNDGLYLRGGETPIREVKLTLKNRISDEARILGDAWERGYGDLCWKAKKDTGILPWYFLSDCSGTVEAFGIKTGPNAMCYWTCNGESVIFHADVTSGNRGVRLCGRILHIADFVLQTYSEEPLKAAMDFCEKMCPNPRLPKEPVYGGNDWYCCYGANSRESILEHARKIALCAKGNVNRPYMVIDDGWQICHHSGHDDSQYFNGGPWIASNSRFRGMKSMAEELIDMGLKPGIWMRPLYTTQDFPIEEMRKVEGTRYTMDPTRPWVLEQVKQDVQMLREWGYQLIKHDFSSYDLFDKWGMDNQNYLGMRCAFSIDTKTTAEIIKELYATIREAAGDDVILIGCNTISHLSAGYFEIQRTGDDTSGMEWERTRKMGVNTLAFRMCQHNRFYAADADCVGITKNVPWEKNRQWLDVLAKSGTVLFVSIADDGSFNGEIRNAITEAFQKASQVHEPSQPVDWMESLTPSKWISDFGMDCYHW